MPKKPETYLKQVHRANRFRHHLTRTVIFLSFAVVVTVFWSLKLTGIGIAGEAFCGVEEHIHSESCARGELLCPLEESTAHVHSESCLERRLICGQEEVPEHIHTDECRERVLVCTQEEIPGHSHGTACYTRDLTCGQEESEAHVHEDACYEDTLHCTQEEFPGHAHGEACYTLTDVFLCQPPQAHTHTDACWEIVSGFGCGLTESQGHTHTAQCLTEETLLSCGEEAREGHTHTDACYARAACLLEEHIHTENCYSDITADLETQDDWEMTFADMTRGPTIRENVVLVARSQLGYTESTLNFQVDEQLVRRGITRYGQWYGNPYGDWSAMFACFCLHYAGAEGLPYNAGPEAMRLEWETVGLYAPAGEGIPEKGNLVFLHLEREQSEPAASGENPLPPEEMPEEDPPRANAMAIITDVDETHITVIQGNLHDAVTETEYALDGGQILGYGLVPEGSGLMLLPAGAECTIWLDGTCGGLGHLTGSPNMKYTAIEGETMVLPDEWTSPSKYSYRLRGWYDLTNACYYAAGAEMEVTGNTVLYADWVAATYDLGQFNVHVTDTVSTNSFITAHMFDYNYLFNVQSSNPQVTFERNGHTEAWSMVTSGNVAYKDQRTFDFIFTDNDAGGRLNMPNNRDDKNRYHDATTVSSGIYSATLGDILFSPYNAFDPESATGILGKTYLGTGDHLFQIMDDPANEYYGYYYYDSKRNAASYHQSNGRFYVYDYLEATVESIGGAYSDFLPLNSPYANTNGKTVGTYTYNGVDGEYQGVPHHLYDAKYNSGDNSENRVYTDYAYGMRMDIKFYLPNDPGSGGNKDMYGNDMRFQFSGDDDLWVLVDGQLVLDIGGIHQIVPGSVDFSTGEVEVNGSRKTSLMDLGIKAGDHTLTVLYLERGAAMSNCSIYFNLAPRFGLHLKKEDVLTQELLDGAEFTVYTDYACTQLAELWESEEAYNQDLADGKLDDFQSSFTVAGGVTNMWGLGSGNTYYIRETGPPDVVGYGIAQGVIRLTIEKDGQSTYHVDVIPDADGNLPSNGYTIHGVRIDEQTQTVYLVVTNAPEAVLETTTVQVVKKWEDTLSHEGDYITAYLTVTDPDGTVRRIREVVLSDENRWNYIWTNLPKYDYEALTEVQYGIEESYESGYYSTVRRVTQIEISTSEWAEAVSFKNGQQYILTHERGCLSTVSSSNGNLTWVSEDTAKTSQLALWTASVSSGKVKFTNGAGQTLTMNNGSSNSSRYFHATTSSSSYQSMTPVEVKVGDGKGFRFYVVRSNRNYYMASSGINSSGRIPSTTTANSGLVLVPMTQITQTDIQEVQDWAYQITNTPLASGNETSLAVQKNWVIPEGYDASLYHEYVVTVRLLANGVNTGRTIALNLRNNWQGSFLGLPYKDADGNVIVYSVEENFDRERWFTTYGEVQTLNGSPVTYRVEITNAYHPGGPELPSTGSAARLMYILCGAAIMLGSLVYGFRSRRKRERGSNQAF